MVLLVVRSPSLKQLFDPLVESFSSASTTYRSLCIESQEPLALHFILLRREYNNGISIKLG